MKNDILLMVVLVTIISMISCTSETTPPWEDQFKPVIINYLNSVIDTVVNQIDSVSIVKVDTTSDYTVAQMRLVELNEFSEYYLARAKLQQAEADQLVEKATEIIFKDPETSSALSERSIQFSKASQQLTDTANIYIDELNEISAKMDANGYDKTNFLDYRVSYKAYVTSTDPRIGDFESTLRIGKDMKVVEK